MEEYIETTKLEVGNFNSMFLVGIFAFTGQFVGTVAQDIDIKWPTTI